MKTNLVLKKRVSFPLPLHLLIDGDLERNELDQVISTIQESSAKYDTNIGILYNYLYNDNSDKDVVITNTSLLEVLSEHLPITPMKFHY